MNKPVVLIFVGGGSTPFLEANVRPLAHALTRLKKPKAAAQVSLASATVSDNGERSVRIAQMAAQASLLENKITLIVLEREKRYEALVVQPRKYFSVVYVPVAGVRAPFTVSVVADTTIFANLALTANAEFARAVHMTITEVEALENTALVAVKDNSNDMYRMMQAQKANIHDSIDNLVLYDIPDIVVNGVVQRHQAVPVDIRGRDINGGRNDFVRVQYSGAGSTARVIREKLYIDREQQFAPTSSIISLYRYDTSTSSLIDFDADIPVGTSAVNEALFYVLREPPVIKRANQLIFSGSNGDGNFGGFRFYIKDSSTLDLSEDRVADVTVYFIPYGNNAAYVSNGWFVTRDGTVTISGGRITHINVPNAYRYVVPTVVEQYEDYNAVVPNSFYTTHTAFVTGLYSGYIMGRTDVTTGEFGAALIPQRSYRYTQYDGTDTVSDIFLSPAYTFANDITLNIPFTVVKDGARLPAYTVTGLSRLFPYSDQTLTTSLVNITTESVGLPNINFTTGENIRGRISGTYDLGVCDFYDGRGLYRSFGLYGVVASTPSYFETRNEHTLSGILSSTNPSPDAEIAFTQALVGAFQGLASYNITRIDPISEAANNVFYFFGLGGDGDNLRTELDWRRYSSDANSGFTNDGRIYASVTIIIGAQRISMRFKDGIAVFIKQYSIRLTPDQVTLPAPTLPVVPPVDRTKLPALLDTILGVLENPIGAEGLILQAEIDALKAEFANLYAADLLLDVNERPSRVAEMANFIAERAILTDSTFTDNSWRAVFTNMLLSGTYIKLICLP